MKKSKVIDCFTFYNELDILELRLLELYSVVDYFILVEAEETFSGKKKDLFFKENQERFRKYTNKIIHVKVSFPSNLNDAWSREKYQRNSFMPSLYSLGLSDKDIVMITDVDEIPNASRISYIKEHYDLQTLNKLEMVTYFGNFRNRQVYPKWYHPKVVNWGTLKSRTPEDCRLDFNCQWWEKSGWHLTYFGSPEMISNKIDSFSHQEYNKEEFKNIDYIKEKVSSGEDLFGEWRNYEKVDPETNQDLPRNWRFLSGINESSFQKKQINSFSVGWISYDPTSFELYLGPSLKKLEGEFNKIQVSDDLNPAANYNRIIEKCKTDWLILCHEDVAFSHDMIKIIDDSIIKNPEYRFFGCVGANIENKLVHPDQSNHFDVATVDCCFIVINLKELNNKFDQLTFDDFHLYVEDFCVQLGERGKTIPCKWVSHNEYISMNKKSKGWIYHHGKTYSLLGPSWGKYSIYKDKLNKKWNRNIPTT